MAPAKGKRSSKKKGGKGAAAPAPPEPQTTVDDNAMQTDETEQPSASTSLVQAASQPIENVEEGIVDTVEVVKEKVAEVAEAAEEFVEEMNGIEEGSGKSGDVTSAESATEPIQKMTMEERKAKLAELRKKMVCLNAASGFSTRSDGTKCIGGVFESKPGLSCGRGSQSENYCPRCSTTRKTTKACRNFAGESRCGGQGRGRRAAKELGIHNRGKR